MSESDQNAETPQGGHRIELARMIDSPPGLPDPDFVLNRSDKYFATAELVERMLTAYRHALDYYTHPPSEGEAHRAAAPRLPLPLVNEGQFTPAMADLVSHHMAILQGNAITLDGMGKTEEAEEAREVANTLKGMRNIIQSVGSHGRSSQGAGRHG